MSLQGNFKASGWLSVSNFTRQRIPDRRVWYNSDVKIIIVWISEVSSDLKMNLYRHSVEPTAGDGGWFLADEYWRKLKVSSCMPFGGCSVWLHAQTMLRFGHTDEGLGWEWLGGCWLDCLPPAGRYVICQSVYYCTYSVRKLQTPLSWMELNRAEIKTTSTQAWQERQLHE